MKLLFCDRCGDLFNLKVGTVKSCGCGHVKGVYTDNELAVVNGNGHSLAIGNGSLRNAIFHVATCPPASDWRSEYRDGNEQNPTFLIAWVRPHSGPANSHTKVDRSLT